MNPNEQKYGIEQSIKGLILPVANTRRHHELISPNRGNKRSAASGGRSNVPDREMDLLAQGSAVNGDSPRGSNESFVLAKVSDHHLSVSWLRIGGE
ncbi:hypothetical protein RF55_3071 [Lasius niger]|uniref:Uncharacterized protein n=1 Tax=Lasius niger TaxID=67767 RepID=A0A0J7L1T5_LASNI|nr:hypothetical protein RF55_3071 [Lasius niger]